MAGGRRADRGVSPPASMQLAALAIKPVVESQIRLCDFAIGRRAMQRPRALAISEVDFSKSAVVASVAPTEIHFRAFPNRHCSTDLRLPPAYFCKYAFTLLRFSQPQHPLRPAFASAISPRLAAKLHGLG